MSHNLISYKTKKLDNFIIDISILYKNDKEKWCSQPQIINFETMEVEIDCGCEQRLKGILNGNLLKVSELNLKGEGSGSFFYYIFNDVLEKSFGTLIVREVWEDGVAYDVTYVNGEKEEIEL